MDRTSSVSPQAPSRRTFIAMTTAGAALFALHAKPAAEVGVWDAIEAKPGWTVDRGQIAVRDASGQLRYYDGVA